MSLQVNPSKGEGRAAAVGLWGVLLLALLLRGGVVAVKFGELTEDRDAYLGIARQVWAGVGFCVPGGEQATAFRPPLYVLLLAVAEGIAGPWGIAGLQVGAGLLVVWGTYLLARSLALSERAAVLAAAVIAVDPLLLRYTPQPMTEIVCTALVVGTAWTWQRSRDATHSGWLVACGLLSGLMMLCRPGMLPWLGVLGIGVLLVRLAEAVQAGQTCCSRQTLRQLGEALKPVVVIGVLSMLVLLPWGVRNAVVLGHFKLTTTHGGYTLLLGNNATFYAAVVRQPWSRGTTWGDYPDEHEWSQARWYAELQAEMAAQQVQGEFAKDRWEYARAWESIRAEPGTFVRACLLRQVRLWWPLPIGPETQALPRLLIWLVGSFYTVLYGLLAIGLVQWGRRRFPLAEGKHWVAGVALVLTMMAVHTLYWTNARMRAPVLPILAVAAVAVADSLRREDREKASNDMTFQA